MKRPEKNHAAVALGRLGGLSKSSAKSAASRENGKKGGRPNKGAILARWDALREAHPDMIWDDIETATVLSGGKVETRYRVRCVCPESYATFGGDPGNIHISACRVIVGGDTPSEGVLLTLIGLQRKATELERIDWTSLDDRARAARETLAKLRADYRATCDVANATVTDEEWARITSR